MEMKETNLGPSFLRSMQAAGIEKVQEYVKRLEEERSKIEAFKRELPFCMQLLNDAIEASRVQLTEFEGLKLNCSSYDAHAGAEEKLVLAELMPSKAIGENLKMEQDVDEEQEHTRSANWIQLWCKSPQAGMERQWESGTISTPKAIKQSNSGAFAPFIKWEKPADLTLGSGCEEKNLNVEKTSSSEERSKDQSEHEAIVDNQGSSQSQSQSQRKARRCWSPELHRRFVSALQQLGGSQVATPKQIRELMKVDGLTNDEVKSHLQKYRLHTRRPSPVGATPQSPQLVVLGGIWMPPEYAAIAQQKQNHQDFFTQLKPSAQLHVHPSLFYDSANPKASTPADDSKSDNHVRSKFTTDDDSGDGDVTEAEDSRGSETRLHLHIGNEAT